MYTACHKANGISGTKDSVPGLKMRLNSYLGQSLSGGLAINALTAIVAGDIFSL